MSAVFLFAVNAAVVCQCVHLQMLIIKPYELWWPVGYGNQTMYTFTIELMPDDNNACGYNKSSCQAAAETRESDASNDSKGTSGAISQDSDSSSSSSSGTPKQEGSCSSDQTCRCNHKGGVSSTDQGRQGGAGLAGGPGGAKWGGEHAMVLQRRIGLRDVELRRQELPDGETFEFVVNGIPVYAKGEQIAPLNLACHVATMLGCVLDSPQSRFCKYQTFCACPCVRSHAGSCVSVAQYTGSCVLPDAQSY